MLQGIRSVLHANLYSSRPLKYILQVVLMDGRIVDATPTQNSDLYKALKGGMANFGTRRHALSYLNLAIQLILNVQVLLLNSTL
jgi:hypothetical protein